MSPTSETGPPMCLNCPIREETILADCPTDLLEVINAVKDYMRIAKDETLYTEGGTVDGVYCQYSGSFALLRTTRDGDEHIVSTTRVGHALGAKDLLQDGPYEQGAIALEDSSVCMIPAEVFRSVIKDYPPIIIRIMQGVCKKLTEIERVIEHQEKTRRD